MNLPYIASIIGHAVLPALTVILASMGGFILSMRNQMITTMDEDFVLVARAKGLRTSKVVWYAARNALLPCVSNFSVAISLVVAGQILVEIVFNYPGIGYHLYGALGAAGLHAGPGNLRGDHAGRARRQPPRGRGVRADRSAGSAGGLSDDHQHAPSSSSRPRPSPRRRRRSRVLRLPRSPKVIAGLVILAVFAVIAIIGGLDRSVLAESHRTKAGCSTSWSRAPVRARTSRPTTTHSHCRHRALTGWAPPSSRRTCGHSSWFQPRPRSRSDCLPRRSPQCSRSSSASRPGTSAAAPTRACRWSATSFLPSRAFPCSSCSPTTSRPRARASSWSASSSPSPPGRTAPAC